MTSTKILLLVSFLFLLSCRKKQLPAPATGTPVFYFKGNINNQLVEINAGVNDYYLFTSYSTGVGNVYQLNGELKSKSCTSGCTNSLKISVGDNKVRGGSSINDIQNVLKKGNYLFYVSNAIPTDTNKLIQLIGAGGYQSYLWSFGDGTTSTEQNPQHIFSQQSAHRVCLTVSDGMGCSKTMCNTLDAGSPVTDDLNFDYSITNHAITLNAPAGWSSYFWSLSDSTTSTAQSFTHNYFEQALYDVCLTATRNGMVKTFCRQVRIPENFNCSSDWSYSSSLTTVTANDSLLSKVVVEWTDAAGKRYNSSLRRQPAASFFTIEGGNNYLLNENSQNTYQYKCSFDLVLYDESNTAASIRINSNSCNWGAAYP